jgi:hypothetical protein
MAWHEEAKESEGGMSMAMTSETLIEGGGGGTEQV